jgi:hypothetical protein
MYSSRRASGHGRVFNGLHGNARFEGSSLCGDDGMSGKFSGTKLGGYGTHQG